MSITNRAAFSKETKELVKRLEDQGWTFRTAGSGHNIGRAPDGDETISLAPRLSKANRGYQNALAAVKRWERANQEAQGAADAVVAAKGTEVKMLGRAVDALYAGEDPILDDVIAGAAAKHSRAALEALAAANPERPLDGDARESRSTVEQDRRPWKARMGSSRSKATTDYYESATTDEITYSDGSKMYACRFEGCGWTSDRPRSVARHFGAAHTAKGEAEKVDASKRVPIAEDVPLDVALMRDEMHRTYSPSERLVRALMTFLDSHIPPGYTTGDEDVMRALAEKALTWFHDRPDLGDPENREREPLTDTEIVAKVRLLVGGRDIRLEADYEDLLRRFDAVCEERDELSVRLGEVMEDRDRIRSDLDTWLSLAPRSGE